MPRQGTNNGDESAYIHHIVRSHGLPILWWRAPVLHFLLYGWISRAKGEAIQMNDSVDRISLKVFLVPIFKGKAASNCAPFVQLLHELPAFFFLSDCSPVFNGRGVLRYTFDIDGAQVLNLLSDLV